MFFVLLILGRSQPARVEFCPIVFFDKQIVSGLADGEMRENFAHKNGVTLLSREFGKMNWGFTVNVMGVFPNKKR